MPLSDVLSSIPGYGGYNAARLRNQGEEQAQLQQALSLQQLLTQQQQMQQRQQLQSISPEQMKDPEFWSRLALTTGKPEYQTHAERLTKQRQDQAEFEQQRGKPAAVQLAGPTGDAPTQAYEGGIFDSLAASENPQIAAQAKQLKASMERSGYNNPRYWQTQQAQLAARETALLNRPEKGAEPLHSIIGPDGKPVLAPRSEAVGKTPYSPSIAGVGQLEPDTLKQVAEQYLAGDRQAIQGYARNAQARAALQNEIAKQARAKGWSGSDIAAQMADFAGTLAGSRVVGQRAANISLAATEAEQMIGVAEQTSKAFDRTNFVPANMALKAFQENTGQPEVKAFGAALNSLVNIYARAINPNGIATVSDKEHARELIRTIDSPQQFDAVMGVLRQELNIAKKAPQAVKDATRERVSPTGGAEPASEIRDFATEEEALKSGVKGKVKIGGRNATIK